MRASWVRAGMLGGSWCEAKPCTLGHPNWAHFCIICDEVCPLGPLQHHRWLLRASFSPADTSSHSEMYVKPYRPELLNVKEGKYRYFVYPITALIMATVYLSAKICTTEILIVRCTRWLVASRQLWSPLLSVLETDEWYSSL